MDWEESSPPHFSELLRHNVYHRIDSDDVCAQGRWAFATWQSLRVVSSLLPGYIRIHICKS